MPGVNTPQFDWIRAKLPGQPRPVGKVYQPEVAARAIYAAAHDTRKEMLVGLPTVEAVWGNKVASSLLDDYLAATGIEAQQRPERVQPDRKDNLFEPVAGDHGAHGSFDSEAVDKRRAVDDRAQDRARPRRTRSGCTRRRGFHARVTSRQRSKAEGGPEKTTAAELSLACTPPA
jgi:hypothetical protein